MKIPLMYLLVTSIVAATTTTMRIVQTATQTGSLRGSSVLRHQSDEECELSGNFRYFTLKHFGSSLMRYNSPL